MYAAAVTGKYGFPIRGLAQVKPEIAICLNVRRCLVRLAFVAALCVAVLPAWADDDDAGGAKFSPEAAATFGKRCTACHTYGKGIKVGPDLKGVTQRRKRDWLLKFIQGSSRVIKSGDPTALQLFAEFKQQRMPDWTDLSEKQVNDILDYIDIGGPDIKPVDERNAELASPGEIEFGRRLFSGDERLRYGSLACSSCHSIHGLSLGGRLGPDLTTTYYKFQDRALTEFLRHPCFQWKNAGDGTRYLAARESFALKAFMRHAAHGQEVRADVAPQRPDGKSTVTPTSPNNREAITRRPAAGKGDTP
jgi:mono/diheme cytochrome c family protein